MTMQDTHVALAHGNGGRYMRELIHEIFARHLANPLLDTESDAAVLPWNAADGQLAFTTDSFTVQPIEFPGGNIGSLAVHGTTNDLAVAGAVPKYLSLGVLLEEGLEFAVLERRGASPRPRRRSASWWSRPATPRSCGAARAGASTSTPAVSA
jgi:hydrogenase expression/formation protein HypE